MKTTFTILVTAIIAALGTWFFLRDPSPQETDSEKKPLYYQSAMHPWIKSDKPGRCTICGMELTPVYPGEKGFDGSGGEDVIALSQSQIQVVGVATEEVAVRDLKQTLEVAGMIDDDQRTHRIVSAYVDSRIDMLFASHHGAPVVRGEPIAMIYSPKLLQVEREYRRLTGPLKDASALRLKQMGLTDAQIAEIPNKPEDATYSMVLAPISGTVVANNVSEGKYVKEGEIMFEIGDFDVMWFLFDAYEQDLPFVKFGQKIDVTVPSAPGKVFPGVVSFIDPNFNETTRTTKVRVDLANPAVNGRRELSHKVYAEGILKIDSPPVLSVPRSAVIQTGSQAFAYVDLGDGAYRQTPVKTGRRGGEYLEVLEGLEAGEKVVTNGALLIDGQAEMDRSFGTPPVKQAPAPALDGAQAAAITDFLKSSDAMSASLAADDLDAFNKASEPAMKISGKLIEALKTASVPQADLDALEKNSHFHGFDGLPAARAAFLKFSMAAIAILEPIRTAPALSEIRIFECPMVDEAVPDADKKGRWIQIGARKIANPYFGAEMLTCGKEIKP